MQLIQPRAQVVALGISLGALLKMRASCAPVVQLAHLAQLPQRHVHLVALLQHRGRAGVWAARLDTTRRDRGPRRAPFVDPVGFVQMARPLSLSVLLGHTHR